MSTINRLKVPCYALQGLKYKSLIEPNKTLKTKILVNSITPTTTYTQKIKLKNLYENKIVG